MQIRPDVYLLKGRGANFYLIQEKSELTLIDTGIPKQEHLLFSLLAELNRQPEDLKNILITHADFDHTGSLAAIQAVTGATVFAGEETNRLLQLGKSPKHLPSLIQWAADTFTKYGTVPQSCLTAVHDGQELPIFGGLQVLSTPGHTPEHYSFFSPSTGILFAGDALNTREGRLQRSPKYLTADQEAANQSAIRLMELAPAIIAAGHGNPLSDFSMAEVMAFFDTLRAE